MTTDQNSSIKQPFEYMMSLTVHEHLFGIGVEPLGTTLPFG